MTVRDILTLKQVARDRFQVSFDGVDYLPTNDTTFAGTLIFGLKPREVVTDGSRGTELFYMMAKVAVYTLNGHVKGRSMPEDALQRWKAGAIALAPCAGTASVTIGDLAAALRLPAYTRCY
jgi:hypothetical protein